MKKALITGITGQDGSYLAEFLLEKGYEVHGITRRASISNTARIDHLMGRITLHDGDLSDSSSLIRIIGLVQPDEIYNLAAQSHVQVSFDVPEYSGDVDALGVLRILEACRILGLTKKTRVYQASTSELYGKVEEVPQRETTPFHPYSPYAVAKQYGFWIVKEYREAYGMFAVNGILFNHESERRGENFVTRKITLAAGRIAEGLQDHPHTLYIILRISPVTQGVHVAKLQVILNALCDTSCGKRDLARNKVLSAALRFMVKQDTVYRKHAIRLTVLLDDPEAILLCNCIRAVRMERSCLALRNLLHLAVKLRC